MKRLLIAMLLFCLASGARALTEDDALTWTAVLDRLEVHDAEEGEPLVWQGSASAFTDLWGLHLTSEGERLDGTTEEGEVQLRISRALSAYWNLEAGWRRDVVPEPERDWAVLGLEGMAPYYIETELSGYVNDDGDTGLRLEAHYDLLFTQRLVLRPALELSAWGQDDAARGLASGLSGLEAGLRLRYEVHRKLAPYLGVEHHRLLGGTADLARRRGGDTGETRVMAGMRLWY